FQAEDGIRYRNVTGVQTCALPIEAIMLFVMIYSSELVELITISACAKSCGSASIDSYLTLCEITNFCALLTVLLTIVTSVTSEPIKFKSDSSLISPAPIINALLLLILPNTFLLSSTAAYETLTALSAISVSLCAFFAKVIACLNR